jgi:hypothetical protein
MDDNSFNQLDARHIDTLASPQAWQFPKRCRRPEINHAARPFPILIRQHRERACSVEADIGPSTEERNLTLPSNSSFSLPF